MEVLARTEWEARTTAHRARLRPYVEPHLARRTAGTSHPVHDFLFRYYSYRPSRLLRWHPGYSVGLKDAAEYADLEGYHQTDDVVTVDPTYVASQRRLVKQLHHLLTATAARPPHLGCFGLHEWAMVYRLPAKELRHSSWPLRLGPDGTDRVVETHRIACSHFDAFRFFTSDARPLNTLSPGRDDRPAFEQPACLHANMDLYKHAYRLIPMISSDLVADCFELAWEVRTLDMRAAPYDLAELGFEPVRVETAEGKAEYAEHQRNFAGRAALLRSRLISACKPLLEDKLT